MHNVPPEVDFESSRSPAKSVLKQSQSALFGSITHMTTLSVFTCMMSFELLQKWQTPKTRGNSGTTTKRAPNTTRARERQQARQERSKTQRQRDKTASRRDQREQDQHTRAKQLATAPTAQTRSTPSNDAPQTPPTRNRHRHTPPQRAQPAPHARPPANRPERTPTAPTPPALRQLEYQGNCFSMARCAGGPTKSWLTAQTLCRPGDSTKMCVDTIKIAASAPSSRVSTF